MIRMTPKMLRNLIEGELKKSKKFGKQRDVEKVADETPEVEASEYAGALVNKIDYVKALKLHEAHLVRELDLIRSQLKKL